MRRFFNKEINIRARIAKATMVLRPCRHITINSNINKSRKSDPIRELQHQQINLHKKDMQTISTLGE